MGLDGSGLSHLIDDNEASGDDNHESSDDGNGDGNDDDNNNSNDDGNGDDDLMFLLAIAPSPFLSHKAVQIFFTFSFDLIEYYCY